MNTSLLHYETEAEFQSAVVDVARLYGWLVFHATTAQRSEPGFPDLLLARGGKVLLAELKREGGKVSTVRRVAKSGRVLPSQADWVQAAKAYVWSPSDWREILEVLCDGP